MSMHIYSHPDFKLDLQASGVEINAYLERKIRSMIKKLKKYFPDMNWLDIYLKTTDDAARPRMVTVRFGIPGPDIVASESGLRWKILLKGVEKRIIRQLEKRKAVLKASM